MRSSKSRSRSKSNRNRSSVGNVVNRVFDSSGPEGKVRGTPQQIIEKYNQLARDAQLAGDRVATENFQQHAEHYLRLLSEAQREQEQRREEQERQNRERQAERDRERQQEREQPKAKDGDSDGEGREGKPKRGRRGGQDAGGDAGGDQGQNQGQNQNNDQNQGRGGKSGQDAEGAPRKGEGDQPDIFDFTGDNESTLVETPESKPKPRRSRKKAEAKPEQKSGDEKTGDENGAAAAE